LLLMDDLSTLPSLAWHSIATMTPTKECGSNLVSRAAKAVVGGCGCSHSTLNY
jgi:hypothetical protein